MSMEKRLSKQKRTEEFNKQFYDTVDRGVFREISEKESRVESLPSPNSKKFGRRPQL